jgi:hypothetical protein
LPFFLDNATNVGLLFYSLANRAGGAQARSLPNSNNTHLVF